MSICRSLQPYVIKPRNSDSMSSLESSAVVGISTEVRDTGGGGSHDTVMDTDTVSESIATAADVVTFTSPPQSPSNNIEEPSTSNAKIVIAKGVNQYFDYLFSYN